MGPLHHDMLDQRSAIHIGITRRGGTARDSLRCLSA